MTHHLVYWKTYWADVETPLEVTCDWFTDKRDFFEDLSFGDSLWVVIPGPPEINEEWRLLQRLFVQSRDPLPADSPYGSYRVIGNPDLSQLFDPTNQPDFAPTLTRLEFSTGHSIAYAGRKIGQSLQSPRELSPTDADTMNKYAAKLQPLDTNWGTS